MKATQAQMKERVSAVLKLRVAGAEFIDVREYARAQQWGVSDSQLWRYVAKSDDALAAAVEKDRSKLLARHLAQRRLLYAKAVETGDWRAALAVLKDEAELQHLYDPPASEAPTIPLANAADVVNALEVAVNEVHAGQLDARTAATLTTMIGTQLRAIETGNLEARLETMEAVLKQRNGDKRQ
jgi:hypothetical protein